MKKIPRALSRKKKIGLFILTIVIVGLILPQKLSMPVEGATKSSYNKKSFWYFSHSLLLEILDIKNKIKKL